MSLEQPTPRTPSQREMLEAHLEGPEGNKYTEAARENKKRAEEEGARAADTERPLDVVDAFGGTAKPDFEPEKKDDIYHMVTEGMGEDATTQKPAQEKEEENPEEHPYAAIVGGPEYSEAAPAVLPGQDDMEAQRVALRGGARRGERNGTVREMPVIASASDAPTAEAQAEKLANLKELRERLAAYEQNQPGDVGGDLGYFHEDWRREHAEALEAYDGARAEYMGDSAELYAKEELNLLKARSERTDGFFERNVKRAHAWLGKHKLARLGISAALIGAGAGLTLAGGAVAFPALALGVGAAGGFWRGFSGGASFVGMYEGLRNVRRQGLKVGKWSLKEGLIDKSLKDLDNQSSAQIAENMAALAANAKVNGSWEGVKEPIEKLHEAYAKRLVAEGVDVSQRREGDIGKSRQEMENRMVGEKRRRAGRTALAVGAGVVAGGLAGRFLDWWKGEKPQIPLVPTPDTRDATDYMESMPRFKPDDVLGHPDTPPHLPPSPAGAPPFRLDNVPDTRDATDYMESMPRFKADDVLGHPDTPPHLPPTPPIPQEAIANIMDHLPVHGLRQEYYDLIKWDTVTKFLSRSEWKMGDPFNDQYPWPKMDLENSVPAGQPGAGIGILQPRISYSRMMEFKGLQGRIGEMLGKLSPDQASAAKNLYVDDLLRQAAGAATKVESATVDLR